MKLLLNAKIVNEGQTFEGSILIEDQKIKDIITDDLPEELIRTCTVYDLQGKYVFPGVIDDQVHFRDPGLTYKGDMHSESRAAVAGGITSFMDMPNTRPQTITIDLLEEKFSIAEKNSLANFSFYLGATNTNADELLRVNPKNVCGIKAFLGASTGNMLVDNLETLTLIFSRCSLLVAVHCEHEPTIQENAAQVREKHGDNPNVKFHSVIRDEEACYKSSAFAVELAKKYSTRLHLLHLSTEKELSLLSNKQKSSEKRITAEACIHHLWFDETDYKKFGHKIRWNPSVKKPSDREALLQAVIDGRIDVIATDHAPHALDEKTNSYFKAMSGGPMVQHSLVAMLELYHEGKISMEKIADKMCHTPADIFNVDRRGYIRKGYWADLVVVDLDSPWKVDKSNILYKCKWSTFEGMRFTSKVEKTFVNGHLVYDKGKFNESQKGMRLNFKR